MSIVAAHHSWLKSVSSEAIIWRASFLFRLLGESIHHVQQGIAWQDVGVGFGATLGVDDAGDVVELTEDVEAVDH